MNWDWISITFTFITLVLAGGLFALPTLLPAVRQLARRSDLVRQALVLSLSLLTAGVTLLGVTRLGAEAQMRFSVVIDCGTEQDCEPLLPDVEAARTEFWLRELLPPPPVGRSCYTDNRAVCDAIETYYNYLQIERTPADIYWLRLVALIIPGISCGLISWRITRPIAGTEKGHRKPAP